MSLAAWETDLEHCYAVFDERHAELREQLNARLIERSAELAKRGRTVPRQPARTTLLRSGLALAASLLLATVAWHTLPLAGPAPAFGLEDLPRRLQGMRSVYLRGTSFHSRKNDAGEVERFSSPKELYVERPRRRYFLHSHFSRLYGLRQTRESYDGAQYLKVDDRAKTAVQGKDQPLGAEYRVEGILQNSITQQLLGGPTAAGFHKVRSEPLLGVSADVYERIFQFPDRPNRFRYVMWLNPTTGLPLRVEHFSKFGDQPEELIDATEQIEIDGAPPAGAFDFNPPADYTVEHADVPRDNIGSELSGGVGTTDRKENAYHALRFCFNIGDRAALICWVRYNDLARRRETDLEGPLGRRLDLTPTSSLGDRTYANHFLRVDSGPDYHWRWSLVVPTGEAQTLGDGKLVFTIIEDDGFLCTGTLIDKPLSFDRDKLAEWIVTAQRLTMPEGAPADEVFTLERIDELIEKFRAADQVQAQ